MTNVEIRLAKRYESDACVDIFRTAWRGMTFVPQDLHTSAEDRRWMRDVLASQMVLVAEVRGTSETCDASGASCDTGDASAAGSGIVGLLSMAEGTIHNLYIRPGYQNQGIGHRLIETAKTCSGGELQLWVFEPNEGAIRFYERHGFVILRKTDGRENEEKVPDRLMAWRSREV